MNYASETAVVYPFDYSFAPLARAIIQNKRFKDITFVAPKGYYIENVDIGDIDRQMNIGKSIKVGIEEYLGKSDVFIVVDSFAFDNIRLKCIELMHRSLELGAEVICTAKLSDFELTALNEKSKINKSKFTYLCFNSYKEDFLCMDYLKNLNSTIIFVGSVYNGLNEIDVITKLYTRLKTDGYSVECVIDSKSAKLAGYHSIPLYIKNNEFDSVKNIFKFNDYIFQLENSLKPDVIIIELPDGLIRYDNTIVNEFGVYAYMVSQAIQADYFICCLPHQLFDNDFYNEIGNKLKYSFSAEVDCFHISNASFDINTLKETHKKHYVYFECKKSSDIANKSANNAYNFFDTQQFEAAYSAMISKLSHYTAVN